MKKTIRAVVVYAAMTILGTIGTVWGQSTYTRTSAGTNLSGDTSVWSPAGIPGPQDIATWNSSSRRSAGENLINADITWAGITAAVSGELYIGNNNNNTVLSVGAQGIDLSAATAGVNLNNKVAFIADQRWTVAGGKWIKAALKGVGNGNGNITLERSGSTGTATVYIQPPDMANGHTGNWLVGSNVELQFYRNAFDALGTGTVTLEDGAVLTQSAGNWELRNNIILGTTVGDTVTIGSRSSVSSHTRKFKLSGVLSGPGNVIFPDLVPGSMGFINQSGFRLTDANTFTGSMTINPGAIVCIGGKDNTNTDYWNASTTGSIDPSVAVINNGSLVFGRNNDHVFPNTITGDGVVYVGGKVGEVINWTDTQNLTLSGNNSHTGGTVMVSEQLSIPAISALGTGPLTLADGALVYTGAGESTTIPLVIDNSPVMLSVTDSSAELAWSDTAVKTQSITKEGTGKLLIGGPLTGDGALTVNAGTLSLTNANNTRSSSVLATVNSGATLALANSGTWSGLIDVYDNAAFDVSEHATPFALGSGQALTLYTGSSVTGSLSVATGSTLTLGGVPQTYIMGSSAFKSDLLLTGGSVCFDLASSPAYVSDRALITGVLKLSASAKTTVSISAGALTAGRYPLFVADAIQDADTSAVLNLTDVNYADYLTLVGVPDTEQTFALITGDGTDGTDVGTLYLSVIGDSSVLTWNGTGAEAGWTTSTGVANWLDDSSVSVPYADDAVVNFTDEAAAKQVTLLSSVAPGQTRFDNTLDYTLMGEGALSGVGDLLKSGAGVLTFANNVTNTFTGAIRISAGSIEVESLSRHLGSGALSFEATTGDSGSLTVTAPAETVTRPLYLSGSTATGTLNIVSGNLIWAALEGQVAGTLLKRGAGELGLSGESCAIEGTLAIQEGSVTLTDGAARTAAIDVKNGASLLLDAGIEVGHAGLNMTGLISGTGSLSTCNTGHLLLYSDMSGFTGTIFHDSFVLALMSKKSAHSGVNIQLNGVPGWRPVFVLGPDFAGSVAEIGSLSGMGGISVQYDQVPGVRSLKINQSVDGLWKGDVRADDSGVRTFCMIKDGAATLGIGADVWRPYDLQIAAGDVDIGAGTGAGTHYGPVALLAADTRILWRRSDASTVVHAAPISGSGSVFIDGAASIVLAGANNYSGITTVSNGTLLINGSHVGGADYSVASGATLGGTGVVTLATGTVNLLDGATLAPGSADGEGGKLTISSLTLAPDACVTVDTTSDKVVVTETLTLNNNCVIPPPLASLDRTIRYPILTCTGSFTGKLATSVGDGSWMINLKGDTFYLQYNAGTVLTIR